MSKHTPGPWKVSGTQNIVAGGSYVVALDVKPSDARRIVACVNATEGVPTEWLENFTLRNVDNVVQENAKLKQQRDELLEALRAVMAGSRYYEIRGEADWHEISMPKRDALEKARAAIAKAEVA